MPTSVQEQLEQTIVAMIDRYKGYTADGKITYAEVLGLLYNGAATLVRLVEIAGQGSRAEKKQLVLAGLDKFYDTVIAPIDIIGVPNMLEPMVDSTIKSLLLSTIDGATDSIFNVFEKMGWIAEDSSDEPQAVKLQNVMAARAKPVMIF
jgi:hypothetical protein